MSNENDENKYLFRDSLVYVLEFADMYYILNSCLVVGLYVKSFLRGVLSIGNLKF